MNIILGRPKTGKSTYIYKCIEDDINSKKDVILFVPSQSRAKAENEYMNYLKKDGIIGVNITTISEYISNNIKSYNLHIDENYISKLDRKILLTQVINENEKIFNVFNQVKTYPGFLDMLNIYMDIFRKECVDVSEFRKITIKNKLLDYKLKEIVSIYEKYIEKLEEKYIDNIDEMDIFLDKVFNLDKTNTKVYFDGYNNFTINEYRFIEELVKKDIDVMISLSTDITKKEDIGTISNVIFEVSNTTYKKLLKIANDAKSFVDVILKYENYSTANDDLKYLVSNVFENNKVECKDSENVSINIYTNNFKEIEEIAKRIAFFVRNGYRYNDICIYTTDIDGYKKLIERIFYEYDIKLYVNYRRTIEESILVKYILGILNIISLGLNIENAFEVLKLGLNDIDSKDIYMLQNYILEFNLNKYSLYNEFRVNNKNSNTEYDLDKLNNIRKNILDIFKDLVINDKNTDIKNIINILYSHLQEKNIFNNYLKLLENENESVESKIYEEQIWPKVCDILDSISKIYENDEVSFREFVTVFKMAIKDTNVKSIPPTLDQVELADINVSKVGMKKIVFFIGVNESNFPKSVEQDVFFGDFELECLKDIGIELKETSISKLNMGLYNIYEALNNVSEKLYISIPASDFSGKATRMSSFITLVKSILNVKIIGDITKDEDICLDISKIFSKDELFDKFIKNIKSISDFDEISEERKLILISLYEYFSLEKGYKDILKFKKEDDNLSSNTLEKLYGNELKTSVSRLEQFKKCPFSYYMQYILNITQRKIKQVNVMDIGSFMHSVLERFSLYLLKNNISFHMILEDGEVLKEEYEKILYKIIIEELENSLNKQKESVKFGILKQKLINTMKKVILIVAKSFNQSEFVPFGVEIEFKEGAIFAPIEIDLADNKKIILNGKIDRVDILEKDDVIYARVVDYKSSSKTLDIDSIKEGLSLQLISYLNVFIENGEKIKNKKIIPAGMLYFNLSDKLVGLSEYTENNVEIEKKIIEALRMKGIFLKDAKILEMMDNKFNDPTRRLIDVSSRSLSGKSKKVLDNEEFESLCLEAKDLLKNIGNEMLSGVVKILPNKKADYCKFCNYSSVCRKDICL